MCNMHAMLLRSQLKRHKMEGHHNGSYAKLLHSNTLGADGSQCSSENINNSDQVSSPQLLPSKRYSSPRIPTP